MRPVQARTRAECIAAAGLAIAEARRLRDTLPVEEAARRAYTPTGPPLEELVARISARRGLTHEDVVQERGTPDRRSVLGMNTVILPVSYDVAGAAAATGISAQMIRRAINAGDLRPHYVEIDGRQVDKPLIRFAELDRWVGAGESERKAAR